MIVWVLVIWINAAHPVVAQVYNTKEACDSMGTKLVAVVKEKIHPKATYSCVETTYAVGE